MKRKTLGGIALLCLFTTTTAPAAELFLYPSRGQSDQQLQRDKFECYEWAKEQTGFDPLNLPEVATRDTQPPPAPAPRPKTSVPETSIKSGIAGALIGAGVGALLRGRRGILTGAAVGGAGGAVIGGAKQSAENRREIAAEKQAQAQAQSQPPTGEQRKYQQDRDRYERAFEACVEGRGYTIK